MGFVRKLTGAQGQIDAANKNAKATEDATKQSAAAQQQALNASAAAAAQQQAQMAARSAAEQKAATVASAPLAEADVQLDTAATQGTTANRRARRASFGRNYTTGVNI